jgi:hypothetical protein
MAARLMNTSFDSAQKRIANFPRSVVKRDGFIAE